MSRKDQSLFPSPPHLPQVKVTGQCDRLQLAIMIKSWHLFLAVTVNQEQLSKITMNNESTCTQK